MKLVLTESGSAALVDATDDVRVAASEIAIVEVSLAVRRRAASAALAEALVVLRDVDLIPLDRVILDRAARAYPPALRALDAIHLSTAEGIRGAIDAFVTYDRRQAEAAQDAGLRVLSPGV